MTIKLEVEQLECTSCANNIDDFLQKQKGVNSWEIDIFSKSIELDYDETVYPSTDDIVKLIKKSGFDAEPIEE